MSINKILIGNINQSVRRPDDTYGIRTPNNDDYYEPEMGLVLDKPMRIKTSFNAQVTAMYAVNDEGKRVEKYIIPPTGVNGLPKVNGTAIFFDLPEETYFKYVTLNAKKSIMISDTLIPPGHLGSGNYLGKFYIIDDNHKKIEIFVQIDREDISKLAAVKTGGRRRTHKRSKKARKTKRRHHK